MRFEWIKSIPDYISYFNQDHQVIIELIGIDNYLILYSYFGKTGIYFPIRQSAETNNNDKQIIINLIGEENYNKLFEQFGKAGIYFSGTSINRLKKEWSIMNRHIDYNTAARTLGVATQTIYRWRQECEVN